MADCSNCSTGARSTINRRQALRTASAGLGYLALASMLGEDRAATAYAATGAAPEPLAPKQSHFPAKAKRIIFLFMQGSISQMDTWEYKPRSKRMTARSGPAAASSPARNSSSRNMAKPAPGFPNCYPHLSKHVDDLCFLRGLHTDTPAHPEAVMQLHTGTAIVSLTRPSMGAWLMYGLGTENQDLPGYITINPPPNFGGAANYGSAFLPAHFQGTKDQRPRIHPQPQGADGHGTCNASSSI